MAEILLLTLAAFTLRILTVINALPGFDSYGHLYFVKESKVQKKGPFGEIATKIVGSAGIRAPFLWHWLIGFFPFEKILQFQKWINPGIDAVFAVLIYLFALWIDLNKQSALFMTLLYLFTPMWFSRLSIGSRLANFTPRLTSEVITNLFFVLTILPLGIPIWLSLMCGALLSSFVLLSSKFGLQALLFLVPLTSLLAWDFVPIGALSFGILLTFALTKGGFLKTLKAQLTHLVWYFRKNLKGEVPISSRNSFAKLCAPPSTGEGFLRHVGVILLRMVSFNSYTSVLIKMPVLFVALVLYGMSFLNGIDQSIAHIVAPVIAAVIVFLLINWPPLLFLGEAERYLNHVAFFIVATAVVLVSATGLVLLLYVVIGYGFLFWLVESFLLHRFLPDSDKLLTLAGDAVISHLKSMDRPMVVLAYPYHAVGVWRIMAETDHNVIYVNNNKEFTDMFERDYAAEYPYVKLDKLDEMASQLGVNYLIAGKKALATQGLSLWVPSVDWQKLEVGEPIYDVYQRRPNK